MFGFLSSKGSRWVTRDCVQIDMPKVKLKSEEFYIMAWLPSIAANLVNDHKFPAS